MKTQFADLNRTVTETKKELEEVKSAERKVKKQLRDQESREKILADRARYALQKLG